MTPGLPPWRHAFSAFRFADGLTHGVLPLAPMLWYDLPVWSVAGTAAVMNLASVPASFGWATIMEGGRGRRRIAVTGFVVSAAAMAMMAARPGFGVYLLGTILFAALGVATAPAASVLVLEGRPRSDWSAATGRLGRLTGLAYLGGSLVAVLLAATGRLRLEWLFLAGAAISAAAAYAAWATIRPAGPEYQPPALPDQPAGRRFERAIWFPMRLRHRPRRFRLANGDPLQLLVVYFLVFSGSVMFFSSYPGVLTAQGLALAWVLAAQLPSAFVSPAMFGWAGRRGGRDGEFRALGLGVGMRLAAMAVLFMILIWWPGRWALLVVLVAHGFVGLSFSLLQVNGSCLLARVHRGGPAQGIGSHHAVVGLGAVAGSLAAFVLLYFWPYPASYAVAAALLGAGGLLHLRLRRSPSLTTAAS